MKTCIVSILPLRGLVYCQFRPRSAILALVTRAEHVAVGVGQFDRIDTQRLVAPTLLTVLDTCECVTLGLTSCDTQFGRHGRRVGKAVRW